MSKLDATFDHSNSSFFGDTQRFQSLFKSVSDAGQTLRDEFSKIGTSLNQVNSFYKQMQGQTDFSPVPAAQVSFRDGQLEDITLTPPKAPEWAPPTRDNLHEQIHSDNANIIKMGMRPNDAHMATQRAAVDSLEERDLKNIGEIVNLMKDGNLGSIDRIVQQYDLNPDKLRSLFHGIVLELHRQGLNSRDFGVYYNGNEPRKATLILIDRRRPETANYIPYEPNADQSAIRYYTINRIPTR